MIRVVLPAHLRTLAKSGREVSLDVPDPPSIGSAVDALEQRFPSLKGTVRDQQTGQRRALIRFFVNGEDWSHQSMDKPLPPEIAQGKSPLLIVGAIAGG
jgi:molybdopterin converting factor small subunit